MNMSGLLGRGMKPVLTLKRLRRTEVNMGEAGQGPVADCAGGKHSLQAEVTVEEVPLQRRDQRREELLSSLYIHSTPNKPSQDTQSQQRDSGQWHCRLNYRVVGAGWERRTALCLV